MSRYWKGGLLLGMMSVACAVGSSAHAERTLSSYEASKLTFSALVAPPSHYRRAVPKRKKTPLYRVARTQHHAVVRTVSYRGHIVSRHKRNTHRRRG